jgi:DDE superfamily endonuclease
MSISPRLPGQPGAGFHIAAALTIPENITLVRLPAYAPELNPIENVWEYLRGNKLAITVFDDYDDIVDKACGAWNSFEQDPKRIASITPEHGQQSIFRAVGIRTYLRAVGPVLPGSAARFGSFHAELATAKPGRVASRDQGRGAQAAMFMGASIALPAVAAVSHRRHSWGMPTRRPAETHQTCFRLYRP